MKTYKGTDKDMKCHDGYQYTLGKKNEDDGAIRCGNKGYHSCEAPMDVLRYFGLKSGNRYFEAEADGKIDRTNADDSKIASSELTIKAEIGLPGIIKAQIEYTRKKAEEGKNGGDSSNLAGGDVSNLAGGDRSNLAGGDISNLAGGYRSNLAGGNCSLIVGRDGCRAKAGINSVIVLSDWDTNNAGDYVPTNVKAAIVDGTIIKADTWYMLKNGEFVEAAHET